jgi:GST-like protein
MSSNDDYIPPKVWKWEKPRAGEEWRYSGINRPIAGPTHDAELRRQAPLAALFARHAQRRESDRDAGGAARPRPQRCGVRCLADRHPQGRSVRQRLRRGESQLQDPGAAGSERPQAPPRVESGSILLYLAEKFGAFLPSDPDKRTEVLNWLFWQMGSTPYVGGGFGHFYHYAPVKIEYAINRFAMEAKRQLDVLNRHLEDREYMAGEEYSIAEMAIWPWYGGLAQGTQYEAGEFLQGREYVHVMRWTKAIAERPAVKRGRMVNRAVGDPAQQLHERHDASDFDTKTQDKLTK